MKIIPLRFKYNKTFMLLKKKKKIKFLNFGLIGLKATKNFILKDIHFKLLIKLLSKRLKKLGNFWLKLFPNFTLTQKPLGTRMGGGKGKCENWAVYVNTGSIFLEIKTISLEKSLSILKDCKKKLPVGIKIITNFK